MPTYAMSCFKLPVTICHEIDSTFAQFWWGSDDSKRRMAWVSWKKMSLPKKEGGLGFNEALLAKQVWRILQEPNCLLARVLKSRYFLESSLQDAIIPRKTSHGWRSIICGCYLLFQGLRYQIGDGCTIDPALDPWIPSHPPKSATNHNISTTMKLKDLWHTQGKHWDNTKLQQYLSAEDIERGRRLYIPQHQRADRLVWHYTKNGKYSVKSGYWLSTHLPDSQNPQIISPHGNTTLKTRIWKTTIPPKLKHFLWRVLSSAIASGAELSRQGIPFDATCKRYCHQIESSNHLLFQCEYARATWRASNVPSINTSSLQNSLEQNIESLLHIYDTGQSAELRIAPFWILWQIWKSRNELIFTKVNHQPTTFIQRAMDNNTEWIGAMGSSPDPTIRTTPPTSMPHNQDHWSPPPPGVLRCNFDASYHLNSSNIGVGWILRDASGCYKLSASTRLKQGSNALLMVQRLS